ncbi:secreted RxLR effector protein 161-like [Impatiens glandulifera]|uniref:secreted RxLR effector protein 161-like n=1 Tax=Impatiens glandulifera TaxID=253017 RepID=UPI001FB18FEA|nr:secreted RxLR effector protein 161-like [Impatiens glandulifera]
MQDSKKGFFPIQQGVYLSKTQCPKTPTELEKMNKIPFSSTIGSIMYAMVCTRPDVTYVLSMCSIYQSSPGEAHWSAAKNILKYLRRTKDDFLVYGGEEKLIVQGYTDASFQTDRDGFESQSGYVFILNGGAVSWKSSKQGTIADSTTEVEYIAASEAAKEAVWMRKFLDELSVVPSISMPINIYCDNNGAIAQAKEPSSSSKSRNVMRKMCKVHTDDNIADPLTKPMPRTKHESHIRAKGLKHIGEWL